MELDEGAPLVGSRANRISSEKFSQCVYIHIIKQSGLKLRD